jgi:hypothetical protein
MTLREQFKSEMNDKEVKELLEIYKTQKGL